MAFGRFRRRRYPDMTLIVPFRDDQEQRGRDWEWLRRFWECQLPEAEIIMGVDDEWPFSKAVAVDEAAARANGQVFVIIDADAWIDPDIIRACVADLLRTRRQKWFVPYTRLYRLTERATRRILETDPCDPFCYPTPPPPHDVEPRHDADYGHQFGAMLLILPREAFFEVGGMDPRFRGWGGEDASFMKALDTLWGQHEVTSNDVLHLWHIRPGHDHRTRAWTGQRNLNANAALAQRYVAASADVTMMRSLVNEHINPRP